MKKSTSASREKKQKRLMITMIILGVIVVAFSSMVNFISDWLWFEEMGYTSVFFRRLVAMLQIGIPLFFILTILFYIYLVGIRKGYYKKIATDVVPEAKQLNRIALIIAIAFSIFETIWVVPRIWFEYLEFTNLTEFGVLDPIFGLDVSFYIFQSEFIAIINSLVMAFVIMMILMSVIYYMVLASKSPSNSKTRTNSENSDDEEPKKTQGASSPFDKLFGNFNGGNVKQPTMNPDIEKAAKSILQVATGQISILVSVFFLSVALSFFLNQFELLYGGSTGIVYGAGFTDINVTLWVHRIVAGLAVVGAIMTPISIRKKKLKTFLIVPVMMIAVTALGTGASFVVQSYMVETDELSKERTYLENNIAFTQMAYDLQDVKTEVFEADNTLTSEDIINNVETIDNIRINDYQPVQTFYNQTQSIRNYYTFYSTDVDRYMINGKYTQAYLSAREIDETQIEQTWLNTHLKYTHGYGIALSRVDTTTANGQPDIMIQNIPPDSAVEEIQITRPEIYFGEMTNNYILVNTDEEEFDYPDGDSNQFTFYEGDAGIELNFFNRLVFAIKEADVQLLVSSNVNSDSRIVINRNVMERVTKIMPYLSYDGDPYIVVDEGKLYWMIDAYTYSSKYPYSEPYSPETSSVNYIRNSVKVVVDAYNGDVDFYISEEDDPIIQTYSKIYEDLFKPLEEMPEGLRSHIRYPHTMLDVQSKVYAKYHMEDPSVFYLNEDIWEIASQIYGTEEVQMSPNYFIFKLPGEEKAEFVSSIPYTPRARQNMTAMLVARSDGDHYGELLLYSLPNNVTIPGPMQIEAAIDQNTEVSQDFSLWEGSGSTYSRGNLFIVPIENSLVYIEPVYLEASASAIPEMKRVIAYYDGKIAYEETLEEALQDLFGDEIGADESEGTDSDGSGDETNEDEQQPDSLSQSDLIRSASQAYNEAIEAQMNGDWAEYGEKMKELEGYLNQLAQ